MTTQQKKVLVAVVGASGGVGSATVKAALAAGHQVRVLARSRTKLCAVLGDDVVAQLDAVVLGDALNPDTLDELMNAKGVSPEVVLSCLGTHNTRAKPCVCDGTQSLIKAIQTTAQRDPAKAKARLVILSSIGVGDSHAQGVSMAWVFIRCIVPLFLRALFADLGRAEEACWREMQTANGVRCVAVRPPAFNDKLAPGRAVVKLVPSSKLKPVKKAALAREDVAVAMARLIDPAVFAAWAGKGVTVVVP